MYGVVAINPVDLQWISFIEVPDLTGRVPMPTAILALDEQEVNRRQRGTRRSLIQWLHFVRGPENFPKISSLGCGC